MRFIFSFSALVLIFGVVAFFLWKRNNEYTSHIKAYVDSYWSILKESRSSIRFKQQLEVECAVPEKGGYKHRVFTNDISGKGLSLWVPEILPEGSPLDLIVTLPENGELIKIKGEVAWVDEAKVKSEHSHRLFNTGIKFLKVESKDSQKFSDYLNILLKDEKK
ncbi:MAG: PilZ domain-containing protein [Candidatus Omnitrophota bacterium]